MMCDDARNWQQDWQQLECLQKQLLSALRVGIGNRLILKYGSLSAAAHALKCSVNSFRAITEGKCSGVSRKVEDALK